VGSLYHDCLPSGLVRLTKPARFSWQGWPSASIVWPDNTTMPSPGSMLVGASNRLTGNSIPNKSAIIRAKKAITIKGLSFIGAPFFESTGYLMGLYHDL